MENQDHFIPELLQILTSPERSALPLLLSGEPSENQVDGANVAIDPRKQLRNVCHHLFSELESLSKVYHNVVASKKKDRVEAQSTSLSGLEELYLGDISAPVDAETLWGQVELQTNALLSILKKSTKSLSKTAEREDAPQLIRLLDMSDDTSISETYEQDKDDEEASDDNDQNEDYEDEESRRIKERMERAMKDMEADEDEEDNDDAEDVDDEALDREVDDDSGDLKAGDGETLVDPAAEELNDGFFDIDEMEGFADEEEEFLPEDAFGTVRSEDESEDEKKPPKKSFHQQQREGLIESENEDDDDDDDDEIILPSSNQVRRKKYREDEEIEALYNLYDAPKDDDDDAVINMTAADFFGRPNKKYLEKQKGKQSKKVVDDDADSWDEQGFEGDGIGWRDDEEEANEPSDNDNADDEEEPIDEDDDEPMKAFDKNQGSKSKSKVATKSPGAADKLQQQIERLEQELIAEKPWQMVGETRGSTRPVNSLLEANPEFEVASKRAPLITVEHTENLEEVIKRRILAEDWDDVIPRELPDVGWNAKRGELPEVSQEKSKLSLGELYEREYLKKAVGYDVDATEKQTAEEQAKSEMKALFASLCSKLDALSNYHFAPRPVAEEADVKPVSTPAIAMEEVLPLHVSEASAVAPEEVYGAKRGRESELKGDSEMDQVERKRLRSAKKSARRKKRKEKLADEKLISRLQPGLGLNNPYEKRKMREELSVARSRGKLSTGAVDTKAEFGSAKFFKKMQEEAETTIRGEGAAPVSSKSEGAASKKSSQFKL